MSRRPTMLNLLLIAGKLLFLLVLYLFIFMVMRSAVRDLRRAAGRASPEAPSPAPAPGHGVWTLAVEASPDLPIGQVYAVGGDALEVGRSSSAGIQLRDTFVSSHHARFTATPEGLLVRDLGSTNGTLVNGEQVEQAWLRPGDHVEVGDSVFRVGVA